LRKTAKKSQQDRERRRSHPRRRTKSKQESIAWIRQLAAPYLKGYRPIAAKSGGLKGYWFIASAGRRRGEQSAKGGSPPVSGPATGFFVGYLESADGFSFLTPQPPECIIFAWIHPLGNAHRNRLVQQQGSLFRGVFEYIRWLTHRPPRFVFHDAELPALTRHQSMREWPEAKREHLSRNFFIETLAWLVRSGMVRKLRDEVS
jgi:hypothetical protein